jgi:hypothetical protein
MRNPCRVPFIETDTQKWMEWAELDAAYASAAAADASAALWREWVNMFYGTVDEEPFDEYYELRKAALNHRGEP